ncbi:MAG: VOC family protein [Pseudonocardiales bacterium]
MDFTIHHAAISAIDMAESVAFYEQFGFRVVLHWKAPDGELEIAHLKLGANYLEIFWYREQVPAPETAESLVTDLPRIGVKHFAFEVGHRGVVVPIPRRGRGGPASYLEGQVAAATSRRRADRSAEEGPPAGDQR